MHPVHKSVNNPLTIWGVERRLLFLALIMGAGTFNFFGSFFGGIAMFAALYAAARWATATDPQMPRILINSAKFHNYYDPAKREVLGRAKK